jgi:hypothetical protein
MNAPQRLKPPPPWQLTAAPKALRHPKAKNLPCFPIWERYKGCAPAIVKAATHFNDPKVLLEVSEDLTGAMKGPAVAGMDEAQMLQTRGW